jgi:cell division protein FtsB
MSGGRPTAFPLRLVLSVLMGIALLYLGWGFVRQVGVNHQRREELRQLEQDIETAQQEVVKLEERLGSVQSPAAVEAWARENGWAKEDEVSVIVVAPPAQPPPAVEAAPPKDVETRPTREVWWDLFFGTP